MVAIWQAQGRRVIALAVAGRTARQAQAYSGADVAYTLDGLAARVEHGAIDLRRATCSTSTRPAWSITTVTRRSWRLPSRLRQRSCRWATTCSSPRWGRGFVDADPWYGSGPRSDRRASSDPAGPGPARGPGVGGPARGAAGRGFKPRPAGAWCIWPRVILRNSDRMAIKSESSQGGRCHGGAHSSPGAPLPGHHGRGGHRASLGGGARGPLACRVQQLAHGSISTTLIAVLSDTQIVRWRAGRYACESFAGSRFAAAR